MRGAQRRKVTPRVKDGIVQKKHRHQFTAALGYVISREAPGRGARHIVSQRDIRDFIAIIPGWDQLAIGLESIVLTAGGQSANGYYRVFAREKTGSIQLPAWSGDLWTSHSRAYFEEHRAIFQRIGLAFDDAGPSDEVECRYTTAQARAFLLLHVFLHELGHHVDRMQTKQQAASRRGEAFAERYAVDLLDRVWPGYVQRFGDPRRDRGE
jgi:hypothetical protein